MTTTDDTGIDWASLVEPPETFPTLPDAVRAVLAALDGAPCSFWACPGVEVGFVPMATCNVCAPQIDLRAALVAAGEPIEATS